MILPPILHDFSILFSFSLFSLFLLYFSMIYQGLALCFVLKSSLSSFSDLGLLHVLIISLFIVFFVIEFEFWVL